MATGPLQPITTPPLLSPLATAAALERRERARRLVLHRAMFFFFLVLSANLQRGGECVYRAL